jgi:hypothetical protein
MWFNRKGIICKLNDSEKATTALHLLNVSKDVLIYYVNSLRNHIIIIFNNFTKKFQDLKSIIWLILVN